MVPPALSALVWSVRMTSEDLIPLDQDPMQSWIGLAHSGGGGGGYVLLLVLMTGEGVAVHATVRKYTCNTPLNWRGT